MIHETDLSQAQLYRHVNDVADAIDPQSADKASYQKLAKSFRLPYWDWARKNVNTFPRLALSETSAQHYKEGFQPPLLSGHPGLAVMNNPLFTYRFPSDALKDLTHVRIS